MKIMNFIKIMMALAAVAFLADATGADPSVTCADSSPPTVGCPDLLVDATDLMGVFLSDETFTATHCAVVEGLVDPGDRRLLRLTLTTPNVGDGDLIVGDPTDHPAWFEWSGCHHHYHFNDFAHYRIWTPDSYALWTAARAQDPGKPASEVLAENPTLAAAVVSGHKQGFCVVDQKPFGASLVLGSPNYVNCQHDQGISVGWADSYTSFLDGQWIDVTGVAPGYYVVEAEVNPERTIEEKEYGNNAAITVTYVS